MLCSYTTPITISGAHVGAHVGSCGLMVCIKECTS
jgi:hypothetical protein